MSTVFRIFVKPVKHMNHENTANKLQQIIQRGQKALL
jgi:hypothetical protein